MAEQITTPEVWPPVLAPRWGVVLDERGSMDLYEVREQAEAERHYDDETLPLVRIDYTYVDPCPAAPAPSAEDRDALAAALAAYDDDVARAGAGSIMGPAIAILAGSALGNAVRSYLAARQSAPVGEVRCVQCETGLTAERVDQAIGVLHTAAHLVMVSGMTAADAIRQAAQVIEALDQPAPVDALPLPDGPKMLRETLCVAQSTILAGRFDVGRQPEHVARLQVLIDALDVMRPLGPDGKHSDRHTPSCGCPDAVDAETEPWQHDGHRLVQHRDGKPPWCNACGWSSPLPAIPARKVGEPRG